MKRKTDFCRSNPELIEKVLRGVNSAVEECQFQFHHRKWNCSTDRSSIRKIVKQGKRRKRVCKLDKWKVFVKTALTDVIFFSLWILSNSLRNSLVADYRETAFIFAITSAGISYHVTRSCDMGELRSCGCSRRMQSQTSVTDPGADSSVDENWRNNDFEWRRCKKNLKYGSDVSAEFMDVARSRKDPRALLIRHNNKAGVLVSNSFSFTFRSLRACLADIIVVFYLITNVKVCELRLKSCLDKMTLKVTTFTASPSWNENCCFGRVANKFSTVKAGFRLAGANTIIVLRPGWAVN